MLAWINLRKPEVILIYKKTSKKWNTLLLEDFFCIIEYIVSEKMYFFVSSCYHSAFKSSPRHMQLLIFLTESVLLLPEVITSTECSF